MRTLALHLHAHSRLAIATLAGTAMALSPTGYSGVTRALLGWNVAVWLYLMLVGWMMWHADHGRLRSIARAQAESAGVVVLIVSIAAWVSLLGMMTEMNAARHAGAANALPHLAFALSTVAGSWLLVPTSFVLKYASAYYRTERGDGLLFPGAGVGFKPDYGDFLYFSFTIAVASQTADVAVSTPAMRRIVLLQSLVSFAFNTAILAFSFNLAASYFFDRAGT